MVNRPAQMKAYEFVVVSALRAQQLLAGSTPRVAGDHGPATKAQMEVAGGHVVRTNDEAPVERPQCRWQL